MSAFLRTARFSLNAATGTAVMFALLIGQPLHLALHHHADPDVSQAETDAHQHGCGHHHHTDQAAEPGSHHHEPGGVPQHDHDCAICGVLAQAPLPVAVLQLPETPTAVFEAILHRDEPVVSAVPGVIPARGPPAAAAVGC